MRKLSEIKGEEAIDVLANIIEPIVDIVNDDDVRNGFETNVAKSVAIALKKHKEEVMQIFAAIDGKEVAELEIDLLTLPATIVQILNEPEVRSLFQ